MKLLAVRPAVGEGRLPAADRLMRTVWHDRGSVHWPPALSWEAALAYSALSPTQRRRSEREGLIRFRRIGLNGSKVAIRKDIDRLLAWLFEQVADDVETDFDFG